MQGVMRVLIDIARQGAAGLAGRLGLRPWERPGAGLLGGHHRSLLEAASRGDVAELRRLFMSRRLRGLGPARAERVAQRAFRALLESADTVNEKLSRLTGLDFLPLADPEKPRKLFRRLVRERLEVLDPAEMAEWARALPATLAIDPVWPIHRLELLDRHGAPAKRDELERALVAVERAPRLSFGDGAEVCRFLHARRALEHLERWRARTLDLATRASVDLARLQADLGDCAAALATVDAVLEAEPDNRRALLLKARLLRTLNRHESAIEVYRDVIAVDPRSRAARSGILAAMRAMGRPEDDLVREIDGWAGVDRSGRVSDLVAGRMPHRAFLEAWERRGRRSGAPRAAHDLGRALAAMGEIALAERLLLEAKRGLRLGAEERRTLAYGTHLRGLIGGDRLALGEAEAACEALAATLGSGARHEEIGDAVTVRRRLRVPEALMFLARDLAPPPATSRGGGIVLVTSSLGPGGAERQLVYTASGLHERLGEGVGVAVVCARLDGRENGGFFLDALRRARVPVIEPAVGPVDPATAPRPDAVRVASRLFGLWPRQARRDQLVAYYRCFAELRPRVVHAWQAETMVVAGFAALLAGVPRIVLSGQSLSPHHRPYRPTWLRAGLKLLLESDQVRLTVNSAAGARDWAGWLDHPPERVSVLHNGLDLAAADAHLASRSAASLRRELGIPERAPVVGAVMRMTEEKRPNLCLDLLLALLGRLPDCHGIMIGAGPMWQEVSARGLASAVGGRLRFPGIVSPVEPWMAAMDLLVLTSAVEGLPNVLLEAQYARTPVAVSEVGGVGETYVESVTGWSFPSDDPGEMAELVGGLLADRAALAAAGEAARENVRRSFSIDTKIGAVLAAFQLDEGAGGGRCRCAG